MLTEDDVMQAYMDSGLDTDWMLFEMVKFARAVIEVNNKKVLADLKPVGACVMENGNAVDCYAGDQVSALIQRNQALEAELRAAAWEFDARCAFGWADRIRNFLKATP